MSAEYIRQRKMIRFAVILLMTVALFCIGRDNSYAASSAPTAKGKVNAKSGIYLKAKASNSAKKVVKVKNDASLTIIKEVYLKSNKTSTKYKWYYVKSSSGKKGYIPASKVDNVKYTEVDGVTTDALNYRVGPDTKMKRVGTLKDNSDLDVVLEANVKGKKTMWYKIKKDKKYYYVCAEWAELEEKPAKTTTTKTNTTTKATTTAASTKTTTTTAATTTTKTNTTTTAAKTDTTSKTTTTTAATTTKTNTTTAAATTKPAATAAPTFEVKDLTYPETLLEKMPFVLRGTITCSQTITSAKFGILNSAGKWIATEEATVGANEFKISTIDKNIKFGKLEPGQYTYVGYVKVNGKEYQQVKKAFTVKKGTSSQKLAATAIQLAWPYGTEKSVYGSQPTDAYAAALDQVYKNHNSWGKGPNTGASCDVFIGTVCRFSGVDAEVPRTLKEIWKYFEGNPDTWVRVPYTGDESQLQSGDIFIFDPNTTSRHICMYLKIDGTTYCAEASYPRALYGFINKATTKFFSTSKEIFVYRPLS